jgi:hypothetical protein
MKTPSFNPERAPSTRRSLVALGGLLLTCVAFAGCAALGGNAGTDADSKAQRQANRDALNAGYSLLYDSVSSLSDVSKVFYVKVESDDVQRVIGDVSDYAAALQADLERIAKDYPAVKIDLDPLPEIEKRKRASISSDTRQSLAPIVGKTGAAFERKLLLSASGALNQLKFKCQVMAAREPVASLRQVLTDAENRFAALYDEDVKLLNERYFRHDTYEPDKR